MSNKNRENKDWVFKQIFKVAGMTTILLLGAIFFMLLYNSIAFFLKTNPVDFFTGFHWNPSGNQPYKYLRLHRPQIRHRQGSGLCM